MLALDTRACDAGPNFVTPLEIPPTEAGAVLVPQLASLPEEWATHALCCWCRRADPCALPPVRGIPKYPTKYHNHSSMSNPRPPLEQEVEPLRGQCKPPASPPEAQRGRRHLCPRIFRQTRVLNCFVKHPCQRLHPFWMNCSVKPPCRCPHPAKVSLYGCTSSKVCCDSTLSCNTYDILWHISFPPVP